MSVTLPPVLHLISLHWQNRYYNWPAERINIGWAGRGFHIGLGYRIPTTVTVTCASTLVSMPHSEALTCRTGRDSSVGIAIRYKLDGPRIDSRWGVRFSVPVQTGPGANPASYTMGTGFFQGVVVLTTHPHLVPRLKKEKSYTSAPPLRLRGLFWGEFYVYIYTQRAANTAFFFKAVIGGGLDDWFLYVTDVVECAVECAFHSYKSALLCTDKRKSIQF